jgi:hypothetical protein
MPYDPTLTVEHNAKHLNVAQCHEHLMRLDEEIEIHGPLQRLIHSRKFFEYHLKRCMKKREEPYHEHKQSEYRQ